MKFLSQEKINEIRDSVDIVDVIGNYVSLTPAGKNFIGVCPFHDDSHPSMSVSREKKIYKCFSCGATGTIFKFVMDYENITFPEAVKKIADIAGINVDIGTVVSKPTKNPLYAVYDLSLKFYTNIINTAAGKEAKKYLSERGINDNIIKEFQIGLSLASRDSLWKILEKQFEMNLILKSGLVGKSDYNCYDLFYQRIMFPLYNLEGQVVAYSGRIYNKEDNSKYFNTRETEIFKKGELLYNYHRAKQFARNAGTVIVVEGFMDVIRMYSIGVKNVVATMGTAVTPIQANIIKKMAKEVILCFDGDKAGVKAALSCGDELTKLGINAKVVLLENNMDPDEYIRTYGKDDFIKKINNSISLMDFKFNFYKKGVDLSSSVELAKFINIMIEEINKINDDILKEVAIKKLSDISKIDISIIKDKINFKPIVLKQKKAPVIKTNKYEIAQRNLVWYMLKSPEVVKMYDNRVTYMPNDNYRFLAKEISLFYQNFGYINEASFFDYITQEESLLETLKEITLANLKNEFTLAEIEDYIKVIYEFNIKNETTRLKNKMAEEEDPIEKAKIAQKIIDLKKGSVSSV